jgi:uncharacterized protein (UPF0332 family)
VSPRSQEFLQQADRRLREARLGFEHGAVASVISGAYYALLYAARAALSEADLNAKTHRGVWHLFHETYVRDGRFDASLHAAAVDQQRRREGVDYGAVEPAHGQAEAALALAERFVAAVRDLLAD